MRHILMKIIFPVLLLPSKQSNGPRRTYLHELSKINNKLEFPSTNQPHDNTSENNVFSSKGIQ